MKVRTALALINGLKDELLGESVKGFGWGRGAGPCSGSKKVVSIAAGRRAGRPAG